MCLAPVGARVGVLATRLSSLRHQPTRSSSISSTSCSSCSVRRAERVGAGSRVAAVERCPRALQRRRERVRLVGRAALGGLRGGLAAGAADRRRAGGPCRRCARSRPAGSARCRTRCRRPALDDRGREADVELRHAHADGLGDEEVPELVDEDEQRAGRRWRSGAQPGTPAASACAHASHAPRHRRRAPARSALSGSLEQVSSARSTSAGMSTKRQRPARNAATASSSAAFRAQGASPPARPAARARREAAERLGVGGLERERERAREVEARRSPRRARRG